MHSLRALKWYLNDQILKHGRETTTILKFSARNIKTYYKMLAFWIVSIVKCFHIRLKFVENYTITIACSLLHIFKENKFNFLVIQGVTKSFKVTGDSFAIS